MNDADFQTLLNYFNLSWNGYRKVRKGVKKRLRRHMHYIGCQDIQGYIGRLETDSDIQTECRRLLTVPITRFFRDRRMWDVLESGILPQLVSVSDTVFRVWCAGCSGGEEAYSVAILWQRLSMNGCILPELEITATDINPECLERAQLGSYSESSMKEVSDDIRKRWFIKQRKQFVVVPELKVLVRWKQRDFFDEFHGDEFDMVFLRNNLLTYYQEPELSMGFFKIVHHLKSSGLLVTGSHETLPREGGGFRKSELNPLIYIKCG